MRTATLIFAGLMTGQTAAPLAAAQGPNFDNAAEAVLSRVAAIDSLGDFSPARAIVMVERGREPVIDVRGLTRAQDGQPADVDTPFYIASMTKAFVGLLGVRLNSEGILPLETTLGQVFPEMEVEGVDFSQLTMRDLLSHQVGFRAPALNIRTAYTDLVPIKDYPRIVNAAGHKIDDAFHYDNLGYLLYAAAIERRTGRSWRAWIDDLVFDPLGMDHSSARTSEFPEVAHLHMRYGDRLRRYEPKSDAVMHAAGGLVVSPGDMARWLKANVGEPSAIPQVQIEAAQENQVVLDMEHGPFRCTGYTFGWRTCEGMGVTFLEHGGSYTGMRAQMAIIPSKGVGFAALFNSDSMTGGLSGRLMLTFLMAYAGLGDEVSPPETFARAYAAQVAELGANRIKELARGREDAKWGGWAWQPGLDELAPLTGIYVNPAFGTLEFALGEGALAGWLNGTQISLEPAREVRFAAVLETDNEVEQLDFERNTEDGTVAVNYLGERFVKLAPSSPANKPIEGD